MRHFTRIYTGGLAEDALQSGREGLLKAIRRFDPDKQVAFATYASCIMGEIRHYYGRLLLPAGVSKDLQNRVDRYVEQVIKEENRRS